MTTTTNRPRPTPEEMDSAFARMHDEMTKRSERIAADFRKRHILIDDVGVEPGPMHACSLTTWNKIADLADVPHIPADRQWGIPLRHIWTVLDGKPLESRHQALIDEANKVIAAAPFWRTDLCAPFWTKLQLSETGRLPEERDTCFPFDDERILDLHYGHFEVAILVRPRMTPVRVNEVRDDDTIGLVRTWPVEFRVFIGGTGKDGSAEHGAVSWYYPQAGRFHVTSVLEEAMDLARAYALRLHDKREELGIWPWMPSMDAEGPHVGGTVDFMLTEERGLVMVDAGPGWGFNAHPCCFIDREVKGRAWHLADGVAMR